jgi:hypothetical protein
MDQLFLLFQKLIPFHLSMSSSKKEDVMFMYNLKNIRIKQADIIVQREGVWGTGARALRPRGGG